MVEIGDLAFCIKHTSTKANDVDWMMMLIHKIRNVNKIAIKFANVSYSHFSQFRGLCNHISIMTILLILLYYFAYSLFGFCCKPHLMLP